ncbi:HEPN domain-containing protein (plasmid) [Polymorphobacter sp. PAMC 29334]|uniref:HEPN domain-containing protein n=1 Tax=Polymorphobacter sp. PAMC 29334 TaxID=2862331 RepID=UPI001C66B71F|nr:HEPN domain-containing protein [Polymorphobacter sp. PAMC 29334]QYE37213.1 HEPN domain-containing protein [Polymorphobacter sp. PAMC 29334]
MSLRILKTNLVHELFVRTADENYITARWCVINDLNTDFLWLSVHALEKYLKSVLLVNGKSSKSYGHDIVKLYAEVKTLAGDLLPDKLEKPVNLNIHHWFERTPDEFMDHLLRNGNADNRYLIYGYVIHDSDLHMLDQMIFAVRRLICPINDRMFPRDDPGAPKVTHRDILKRQPEYYGSMGMPLDTLITEKKKSDRRVAALNLNMAFAPSDFLHKSMQGGSSSRNPVIIRRILDPLASDDRDWAAEGVELAEWFMANVQLPSGSVASPGVIQQINAAIDKAKIRHNLQ